MKATKKTLFAVLAASVAASLGIAVWRTVLMLNHYDPYKQGFDMAASGKITLMSVIIALISVAVCALGFVFGKTESTPIDQCKKHFSVFSNAFCGAAFIIADITALIYKGGSLFASAGIKSTVFRTVTLISVILMIPCGIYYIICASTGKHNSKPRFYLSMFLPVWAIFFLCSSYFDGDYTFADPNRKLANLAIIAVMLMLLTEARACVGRKENIWRFIASVAALSISIMYFLPTLALTLFWEMEATGIFFLEISELGLMFCALSYARNYAEGVNE